jgi:O-acetyl-ADP-ribose deacetylase
VALPAISTGIYGLPVAKAASISLAAARSFAAKAKTVKRILFAFLDDKTLGVFEKALVQSQ